MTEDWRQHSSRRMLCSVAIMLWLYLFQGTFWVQKECYTHSSYIPLSVSSTIRISGSEQLENLKDFPVKSQRKLKSHSVVLRFYEFVDQTLSFHRLGFHCSHSSTLQRRESLLIFTSLQKHVSFSTLNLPTLFIYIFSFGFVQRIPL